MKKSVNAGIIAGMCVVIAIPIISMGSQTPEPTDDIPNEIIISVVASMALAFYLTFIIMKGWKPSPTPFMKLQVKLFKIVFIGTAILGVIVMIRIFLEI